MSPPPRLRGIVHQHQLQLLHGEVVFMPQERVDAVYLVERGGVVVFAPSGNQILTALGPLRIIGLRDMLAGGRWQGIGLAHGPTVLRVFETSPIMRVINAAPDGHQRLLRELSA
ncbi:cyclic nucleotide-binding domain-containing protein [Roseicyclus sp.]|uniref:cyclic nucleotide-binding domain-containing protein n=1 Tax=Roseicyclus sp. TaxID=1914329 RepID=UPI003F6CAF50